MKILLIDTCGTTGSLALADTALPGDRAVLASAVLPARSASERLSAEVRGLAGYARMELRELGVIAVVHGPGSFTGVRVGVSLSKGLSEALGVPVIAISRLAVMACSAVAHGDVAPDARVVALLDAGRGEFYCGLYEGNRQLQESLTTQTEAFAVAAGNRPVVCEEATAVALAGAQPLLLAEPLAQAALPIVLRRISASELDDVATLDANYLRRTDAEIFAKQVSARAVHDR